MNGTDVNLEQVRAGYACHYKQYQDEQTAVDWAVYSAAESEARAAKRNIRSVPNPTPPWEFRNAKQAAIPGGTEGAIVNTTANVTADAIIGNRNSRIYHRPGCRDYNKVAPKNRVLFRTAAEAAGYRAVKNC